MKVNIRKSIFETNSSSIHCITIGNNGSNPTKFPEKLVFEGGQFGWEHRIYTSAKDKASYLYTALIYLEADNDIEEVKSKISEILSKWGVKAEFEPYRYYRENWIDHYIDHGFELNKFVKILLDNEEYLMNYLFSDDSYIETGNDNEEIDWEGEDPKNILYEYKKGN